MSFGSVSYDTHEDVIMLKPENSGFNFGDSYYTRFYENSKAGLKRFLDAYAYGEYPKLYISNRVYYTDEQAKIQDKIYHEALSHVVWTDNPDVSFVPCYDTHTKSETFTERFDLLIKRNYNMVKNPGIKGKINHYLTNLTKGGKELVINSINLIHTHYYSSNDKEIQVEVSVLDKDAKKLLIATREKIKLAEEIEAKKKAEEEAIKQAALELANQNADKIISESLFGQEGGKNYDNYNRIKRYLIENKLSKEFLNLTRIEELVPVNKINDKDYIRISDIIEKSNKRIASGKNLAAHIDFTKAVDLAYQMNKKITDEAKRIRRANAANSLGLGFLAACFK